MRRPVLVLALLVTGAVLGVPAQAAAAEPVHRTLAKDLDLGRPAGRVLDARLPWRANMVGVSLPGSRDGEVEVSLRAFSGGAWTRWATLDADGDHAPDGAERLRASRDLATDAVWVGAAERVQVRLDTPGRVPAVRVHALNTAGDAYEVSFVRRALRAIARFLSLRPATAEAATSTPAIIRRSQWGGPAYTTRPSGLGSPASELKMVFMHHTDNPNSYTRSRSAALVRGIHAYHTRNRGFSDIGYNFLVDRYGQIFEGRWGGITNAVIGAHTLGFNRYSTGIALLGTYSSFTPPTAMQTSVKRMLAWKMDVHHIPVIGKVAMTSSGNERYDPGEVAVFNRVSGHRNAKPTACPGARAYALLPAWRTGANAIGHPKIVLPSAWTTTGRGVIRPDGDGVDEAVRFRATFTRSVAWTLTISGPSPSPTYAGSGTSMNVVWDPRQDPALPETGRYTWTLEARIPGGAVARAATGRLWVVTDHPAGTLLRDASGEYVLGAEPTRQDATAVTRASHFGAFRAVPTGPRERTRSPLATALALREGTLLQGPDGARYIVSGGMLRRFVSEQVFSGLGYRTSAVISADEATILAQPAGSPVEDVTRHPDGTAIVEPATGEHWVIDAGTLRPVDRLALRSRYRDAEIVLAAEGDLALTRDLLRPVELREGALLRGPDTATYVYTGGTLFRFRDHALYIAMGYTVSPDMRLQATQEQLDALGTPSTLG